MDELRHYQTVLQEKHSQNGSILAMLPVTEH